MFGGMSRQILYVNLQEMCLVQPSLKQQLSSASFQSPLRKFTLFLRTFLQHMSLISPLIMRCLISLVTSLSLEFYFHWSLPNPKTSSSAPRPPHIHLLRPALPCRLSGSQYKGNRAVFSAKTWKGQKE